MCIRTISLFSLILLLGLAGVSLADMVAYWPLDEGIGGITPDESGNGLDGTLVGRPTFVAGMFGQAIQLDGSNTMYVDCGTDPAFDITEQLTVAAWIKMDHVDDRQPIVNKEGDGVRGVGYRVEPDGIVHVQLYVQGWTAAADKTDLNSTVNLEPDRWYHVAYTYEFVADGSSITVLYIDGEENVRTETTRGPLTTSTQIQEIGRYVWSASYQKFFNGLIDDVVIFNHVLSADEIQGIMNGVGGGFPLASSPDPRDSAIYEDTWVNLSWRPGDSAVSHDVYLGDNFDDVNNGTRDSDVFRGNQSATLFTAGFPGFLYPDGLVPGTTYYWRIDEVNDDDPNSPWKGDVWSFWIPPGKAYEPNPADGVKFVDTDAELSWTAGFGAKLHTIYFGDNFNTVANKTEGLPQSTTTYTPGNLELDKTYYWRVDEFDGSATHTGEVWSFTTIPIIPITDATLVGWWKLDEGSGTTALDWSGNNHHATLKGGVSWAGEGSPVNGDALSFDGYSDGVSYTTDPGNINWVSVDPFDAAGPGITLAAWIRPEGFDISDARIITKQKTWSSSDIWWMLSTYTDGTALRMRLKTDDGGPDNGTTTMFSDTGYLEAGVWSHAAATYDGSEMRLYHNGVEIMSTNKTGTIQTDPTAAVAIGNGPLGDPGGLRATFHGLIDDVRIYNKGVTAAEIPDIMRGDTSLAWGPSPSNKATVSINQATPLSWSPGDEAAQHDVYFGTDRDAVADADTSTAEVYRSRQSATSYTPPEGVEWGGGPYYWRIDEYNTDGTISTGRIWSFTVADFILVDDFESYTDDEAAGEAIWQNWTDGYDVPDNGAQAGYLLPPYAEPTIVHGGLQSLPLLYDNTAGVTNSEAALTLTAPRDWTKHGVGELSLWFRGNPASVGSFTEGPVGACTMTATGGDIWNDADQFHFAFKTLTGVGSIEAKVLSVDNTDPWAKAGVMIRETLEPGSKFAAVYITPGNGCRFEARGDTSVNATSDTPVATDEQMAITAPYWVKLERDVAGSFRGYYSGNGSSWTPMSWNPLNLKMSSNVYAGLALTAHNNNATCEAKFSNVQITGTADPHSGRTRISASPATILSRFMWQSRTLWVHRSWYTKVIPMQQR